MIRIVLKSSFSVVLMIVFTIGVCAQNGDYNERILLLQRKIIELSKALENTEGFALKSGAIDVQIALFFSDYIAWELANEEQMKDALMGNTKYGRGAFHRADVLTEDTDDKERNRRYIFHIDQELNSCMEILDQAMHRLEKDMDWPEVYDINWSQVEYSDGYFRDGLKPVFSGGFSLLTMSYVNRTKYPDWIKKEEQLLKPFLQNMHNIGVGILDANISIPRMVMQDGTVNRERLNSLVKSLELYEDLGFKVDMRFGWDVNKAVLEANWPGITEKHTQFVYFDIDHPGAKIMIKKVMSEVMPVLQKQSSIVSWDMANEPGFFFNMWSEHTLKKYREWLCQQYSTVDNLNGVWKTNYPAFSGIPFPADKPKEACSEAEWYDRVTFHNYRTLAFFSFFQGEIRKYVPDAIIHIKAQDNNSLGPRSFSVTDGIDREMLSPLLDIQGVDTRPLPVTEPRMAVGEWEENIDSRLYYDNSIYGFHWLGQSFLYDYLTSFTPEKPIIDHEYHAFSINSIRVPDIKQSHPRAALWLAFMHGQINNISWYWHRRYGPNPFFWDNLKLWFYGSISTQPLVAAEYFQTMLRLNAFSEEVEALAKVDYRPVRLFVSKPSYIQNQAHISALHRAYEGTCFHGIRMGFVTEEMLAQEGIPEGCKMIIIPDAEYVSEAALKALGKAQKRGIQLLVFGNIKPSKNAHGAAHPKKALKFLEDVPMMDYAEAPVLSSAFETILAPLKTELPVRVSVENGHGSFGVMHRQANVNGKQVVLLVNVSDKPLKVLLKSENGKDIEGYDMLNGALVQGQGIDMPFQGVRLIRVLK